MKTAGTLFSSVCVATLIAFYYIISANYYFSLWLMPHFFPFDSKRILELVVLTIGLAILMVTPQLRQRCLQLLCAVPLWIRLSCTGVLMLGVVSSLLAPMPKMALMQFFTFVALFFFAFLISTLRLIWKEDFDRWAVRILFIAITAYILYFFWVYISTLVASTPLNAIPGFSNIRIFAHYLVWTLPILLIPLYKKNSRMVLITISIIALTWWSLFWLENAKGLLLAYGVSAIAILILFKKPAAKTLLICLGFAGTGLILYWLCFLLPEHLLHSTIGIRPIQGSVHARWELWKLSWHYIKLHPWLGLGPLHFAYYVNPWATGPSNGYLSIATQWGIPAFILCASVGAYAIIKWIRFVTENGKTQTYLYLLTLSLFSGLCYMFVSGVLNTATSQILMAIVFGWIMGIYFSNTKTTQPSAHMNWLWLVVIITVVNLAWIVPPQLKTLTQREMAWYVRQTQHLFYPQYWMQGWINEK